MDKSHLVRCITTTDKMEDHKIISHIGGKYGDNHWWMSVEDAIKKIELEGFSFWVSRNGKKVAVVVATREGTKYLKTDPDDSTNNNLLELPACPA